MGVLASGRNQESSGRVAKALQEVRATPQQRARRAFCTLHSQRHALSVLPQEANFVSAILPLWTRGVCRRRISSC